MYYYDFWFGEIDIDGRILHFSIIIQADTGYCAPTNPGWLDVGNFTPVEKSKTRLIFL